MDEDKVLAALAGLEARLAGLQGSTDAFRGAVMGKLEQVQDELTALRADVSVVSFAAMRGVKRTEGDREDVRDLSDMVNKMWLSMLRMRTDIEELQKKP